MGQVSANKEKLCGADQQRKQKNHRNCDQRLALMRLRCKQQNRENEDQSAELCCVEVIAHKANQPSQQRAVVGGAEVGVSLRFRHPVMPMVVPFAGVVVEAGVEP